MTHGKKILALVLARKNSKRIKNKNICKLGNKPLISWTLETLKKNKIRNLFTDVLISTDSEKIRKIALDYNFLSPWIRPKKLSNQFASSESAALHALKWYELNVSSVDGIFLFQPTSPFRSQNKISLAVKIFSKNPKKQIVSVCARKTYKFNINDINGSMYLTHVDILKKFKTFKKKNFTPFKIYKNLENVDIDTLEDFSLAKKFII